MSLIYTWGGSWIAKTRRNAKQECKNSDLSEVSSVSSLRLALDLTMGELTSGIIDRLNKVYTNQVWFHRSSRLQIGVFTEAGVGSSLMVETAFFLSALKHSKASPFFLEINCSILFLLRSFRRDIKGESWPGWVLFGGGETLIPTLQTTIQAVNTALQSGTVRPP